ncbi:hypothetical protein CHS0354_036615 [Potamilus streckersoni]|uniref:Uncharacterized protein n=1 Tax=Potamilus streckersoni TaxID=2493646 RepID=A0AAE0WDI9_9BIVA|nr:hypothetical protein CHS0354_036615 [Potamilus streckersoni]
MDRYLAASDRAANYLASQIQEDGTLANSEANQDVAAMYKLTTLLLISGKITEAQRLLNRIKKDFLQANGDVVSFPDKSGRDRKSSSDAMSHHWNYLNVWIALGAQRLGRFDVSQRIFAYSKTFYSPAVNACCVTDPYDPQNNDQTVDTLNTAHLGLLLLYFGDLKTAKACGETLIAFVDRQPNFDTTFYQRMSAKTGELITSHIPDSLAPHFVIRKNQPYQLYFYIGYYVIFMTKLYKVTQERKYIDYAQKVLDFALDCDKSIYTFFLSHKVAYGAALVASETKFEKYHNLATTIADFLVSQQTDEGLFCKDLGIIDKFDQSTEIGIWLREIHAELASQNKTFITK